MRSAVRCMLLYDWVIILLQNRDNTGAARNKIEAADVMNGLPSREPSQLMQWGVA